MFLVLSGTTAFANIIFYYIDFVYAIWGDMFSWQLSLQEVWSLTNRFYYSATVSTCQHKHITLQSHHFCAESRDIWNVFSSASLLQSDSQQLVECRVRFLSFLGIGKDVNHCAFIMHTAQDQFIAHVLYCQPSSGALCKTIEAACKVGPSRNCQKGRLVWQVLFRNMIQFCFQGSTVGFCKGGLANGNLDHHEPTCEGLTKFCTHNQAYILIISPPPVISRYLCVFNRGTSKKKID